MKVFFIASIHGQSTHAGVYQKIVSAVEELGHKVKANHVLTLTHEEVLKWNPGEDASYFKNVVDEMKKAEVIIAETSYPSISVGYMMNIAMQSGRPVIILYNGSTEPHIFRTIEKTQDKVQIVRYNSIDELKKDLPFYLDFAANNQDTRFNFFISPEHSSYLDWVAKNRKIPRSVYLRQLMDEDMERQKSME